MSTVQKKLAEIQVALAVEKGQRNDFGKYQYRNAEDILKAVKPLLGGLTVVIDTNIHAVGDRVYVEAVAILSDGERERSAKAYAREPLHRKGMDESQITGAATSYAKKYALGNLFAIDNEADADSMDNSQEGEAKKPYLTVRDKADWARAVAIYKRDGNLDIVAKAREITPEVRAAIISQAQAEQYAEDASADNKTLGQGV